MIPEEENYSAKAIKFFWGEQRPLPGYEHLEKYLIREDREIVREDGYIWPTKPMRKWEWMLRYYASMIIPFGCKKYKRFP